MSVNIGVTFPRSHRRQGRPTMMGTSFAMTTTTETKVEGLLNFLMPDFEFEPSGSLTSPFYVLCNGRRVDVDSFVENGRVYHFVPRVLGGKGGFGSMLRAIGAQIEKTTSREACRDLSGRRMRDINNEKKLKDWLGKEAEREQEREDRRSERLARHLNPPQHKFEDAQYQEQKVKVQEDLQDALQTGLKRAHSRSAPSSSSEPSQAKKSTTNGSRKEWLGVELDSDDTDSDMDANPIMTTSDNSCSSASNREGNNWIEPKTATGDGGSTNAFVKQESKDSETPETSRLSNDIQDVKPDVDLKPQSSIPASLSPPTAVDSLSLDAKPDVPTGPVNLDKCDSVSTLGLYGLDRLKKALMERGMKCGGTMDARAERLFSVKGVANEDIHPSLLAKAKGKGKNRT